MEKQRLKKYTKNENNILYLFIISVIVVILALVSIGIKTNKVREEVEKFKESEVEMIALENKAEKIEDLKNKSAYIQVQTITDYFATNGEEKFYFVSDGQYIYIAELNEKNFENLKTIYDYTYRTEDNVEKPERIKISGMTKEIPIEFAKIIIEEYNEMVGEELLTDENWYTYVGNVYLETSESLIEDEILNELGLAIDDDMEIFIIVLAVIFAISFLVAYIANKISINKMVKKFEENDELEKIFDEIDEAEETSSYFKGKVVLTKSYYVDLTNGFKAYRYEDIKWIYMHQLIQYVVFYTKSIMILEKDKKSVEKTASKFAFGGKNKEFERLFNDLCEKLPNALKGYSKENIKASKEQ